MPRVIKLKKLRVKNVSTNPFRKQDLGLLELPQCKFVERSGFDQEVPQKIDAKGYNCGRTAMLVAKLKAITEKNLFSARSEICKGYKYTLVKASNNQLEKREAFCHIMGSVCHDMTSMLHWFICR